VYRWFVQNPLRLSLIACAITGFTIIHGSFVSVEPRGPGSWDAPYALGVLAFAVGVSCGTAGFVGGVLGLLRGGRSASLLGALLLGLVPVALALLGVVTLARILHHGVRA
jgi:hypothetical protein